jgi:hypothetical protein
VTFPNELILLRGLGLRLRLCDRLHDGIARVAIRIAAPVVPRTDLRAGATLFTLTFTAMVMVGDRASFARKHIGFGHVGIGRVADDVMVTVFGGRDGAADEYEPPEFAILGFCGITVRQLDLKTVVSNTHSVRGSGTNWCTAPTVLHLPRNFGVRP